MAEQIRALVLAGGESKRMGLCKQTLPLGGKPVIAHVLDSVFGAVTDGVTVVTGKHAAEIRNVLQGINVQVVENTVQTPDMASSVRMGLAAMEPVPESVMICLSDHPLVRMETIKQLLESRRTFPGYILIPEYQGRGGHPVIFPGKLLALLSQGGTLREIIRNHGDRVIRIPVDDCGVVTDMDTPEDYKKIQDIYNNSTFQHEQDKD